MDYFVIALIEELEKIANVNEELKLKAQTKVKNAVNNDSAKKLMASKNVLNNKPKVGTVGQQNAIQYMEDIKDA